MSRQSCRRRRRLQRRRRPRRFAFAEPVAIADANADADTRRRPAPDSSGGSIGDLGQPALQPDDHQPGARHGAARRQRAGQLQRLHQRVRLGGIVLGRHSRPQGAHAQSVAAGRHRLHPVQRGRLQRHQRADRRVRAALRFHRLGIVAAVLRRRRHPVAVREGALQPQLHDEPRRGVAGQLDQQPRTTAPTAAPAGSAGFRRATRSRRPSKSGSCGSGSQGYADPAAAFNPFDASIATGTDRTSLVKIGGQWTHLFGQASRATSTADGCSPSRPIPASSPP